jgi:hypothetical protein
LTFLFTVAESDKLAVVVIVGCPEGVIVAEAPRFKIAVIALIKAVTFVTLADNVKPALEFIKVFLILVTLVDKLRLDTTLLI